MISRLRLALLSGLVATGFIACDKVPLMAPSQSTLTLSSSHTILAPNETAEITATVIEIAGTPVQNGTLVLFTTTVGQLDLREARTHNGVATVRLSAGGASGEALVNASSGSAKATELKIKIGAFAADTVTLTAEPATVAPTGGTVTLVASVVDANGRGLVGIPVSFSASAGTLSATSAVTDAAGEARVTLTTFQETTVTARVGTKVSPFTVSVRTATTLAISAAPPSGGVANSTIVFTVTPSALVRNTRLDFGDGDSVLFGTVTGPVTASHLYSRDGAFIVRATGVDASGDPVAGTLPIVVLPLPPLNVTIGVSASPKVDTVTTFTVTVTPSGTLVSSYRWNFDGVEEVSTSNVRTRIYTTTGNKRLTVTVTTQDGRTGVADVDIVVGS